MLELLILLGLAFLLRKWLQAPTDEDYETFIIVDEFED